jgi:hypothetical protein
LPEPGFTHFYLLTGDAVRTAEAKEGDLRLRHHPIGPLFRKGQNLITEIRLIDESKKKH